MAFTAPISALNLNHAMDPQRALACHQVDEFQRLSVISLDGSAYYRVASSVDSPARYFSVEDCRELPAGDETYARQLASHYTGMPESKIKDVRLITQFDEEYLSVNRLLPVWRVEFAGSGHLRAYIDTDQSRLSTLIDDTRYVLGKVFRLGHNWAFLDELPGMQLGVMSIVLSSALFSAVSGITLYVRRRRHSLERLKNQSGRRWHRRLGLLVAITTLTFAGSGMFHLFMSYQQQIAVSTYKPAAISTANLSSEAWQQAVLPSAHRIDLVPSSVGLHWLLRNSLPPSRVAVLSHKDHHPAAHAQSDTLVLPADKLAVKPMDLNSLARNQAMAFAHQPELAIVSTELVTQFGGEYGFIFKRLPVVKIQFEAPGNPRYYIEPATGTLAAEVRDLDAAEGTSFAYMHKWTWLDANKEIRDVLMMLFALGNVLVALLGLWLFARKGG